MKKFRKMWSSAFGGETGAETTEGSEFIKNLLEKSMENWVFCENLPEFWDIFLS